MSNEPRLGVPSITSRPPRPCDSGSSMADQVSEKRAASVRETSPPMEWATMCTAPPAPNARSSPSSRAALRSSDSRQSYAKERTSQRASSSISSGRYEPWWTPAVRTWVPGIAGSPAGVRARSPRRPEISRA